MPFAVWCGYCRPETVIGQGVRFNASKTRSGSYYSTPIWQFRMRHADCGGEIVIRTDPRNTAYLVVSGGRKRDTGEDDDGPVPTSGPRGRDGRSERSEGGGSTMEITTDAERERLRQNAFAKLERTIDDRERLVAASRRIDDLLVASDRQGRDPYAVNAMLRRGFRQGRRARQRDADYVDELCDRIGLDPDVMLPASQDDVRRAALVDFTPQPLLPTSSSAMAKPLFPPASASAPTKTPVTVEKKEKDLPKDTKDDAAAKATRSGFAHQVMGNTRITRDPFLGSASASKDKMRARLAGVKRKRRASQSSPPPAEVPSSTGGLGTRLVAYDSD
ncbi:coiled-coil domain-containing protein 130 [Geosmithia morbida]|uniref:Coiled-coil domain-containing protein 130 n=1 Tax=Geosmithia morbida TaxID=1094350 RepID=A0A9P5D3W1_9HYPO|nr:coiled-coil domain-containing protein 130 [Geosmithia morbida]KAF4122195.1 coiled-coil domain-containing protein 130 [Geosmithia morbida]